MKKLLIIIAILMLSIGTVTIYATTNITDNIDAIIEYLHKEIEEHDKEINRMQNIVNQIENKYCTKNDLIFGVNNDSNQKKLYQESLNSLIEKQEMKLSILSSLENTKEIYQSILESNEKSTLKVIDKWLLTSQDMVGDKLIFDYPTINTEISSGYGYRIHPILGTDDFHGGVDFPDEVGTNIYASEEGMVVFADYNYSYGNVIVLMHDNGYFTLYGHIDYDGILVRNGDLVEKGQLIAKMGSTGMSTGPHVHFEIIENGVKVDPLAYLNKYI